MRDYSGLCNRILCLFSVGSPYVTNFLILLQYNIRPPSSNCDQFATKFVFGVNLRRHDTSRQTVRPYDISDNVSMSDYSSYSYSIYNISVSYNLRFLVN